MDAPIITLHYTGKDTSGVPITCPKIDKVIKFLKKINTNFQSEAEIMIMRMEDIRQANTKLREYGIVMSERLAAANNRISELEITKFDCPF